MTAVDSNTYENVSRWRAAFASEMRDACARQMLHSNASIRQSVR